MGGRRTPRTETVARPLALLAELRPARDALIRAMAAVRAFGPAYLALSAAMEGIDALAAHLGHKGYYLEEMRKGKVSTTPAAPNTDAPRQ